MTCVLFCDKQEDQTYLFATRLAVEVILIFFYSAATMMSTIRKISAGWILTRSQMKFLSLKPYFYNAFAGSVLELLFLQR
jgi:hypothetical protein